MKQTIFYKHCVELDENGAKNGKHFLEECWGYRYDYPDELGWTVTVYYDNGGWRGWTATEAETGLSIAHGKTMKACEEETRKFLPKLRRILNSARGAEMRAEFMALVAEELERSVRRTA